MKKMILALMMIVALTSATHAGQEGFGIGSPEDSPADSVVICDYSQKTQKHELKVSNGASVAMQARANPASTGNMWASKEGLRSEFLPTYPELPGSDGTQSFNLPLTSKVNKFTFKYKRGQSSYVISTCVVIVTVQ